MARNKGHIFTDKVDLELLQCDCGFHIAIDSDITHGSEAMYPLTCPNCNTAIDIYETIEQGVEE
jgi:hypothetical protein